MRQSRFLLAFASAVPFVIPLKSLSEETIGGVVRMWWYECGHEWRVAGGVD